MCLHSIKHTHEGVAGKMFVFLYTLVRRRGWIYSGNKEGTNREVDDVVKSQRKHQHDGHGRCAVTKSVERRMAMTSGEQLQQCQAATNQVADFSTHAIGVSARYCAARWQAEIHSNGGQQLTRRRVTNEESTTTVVLLRA